MAPKNIRPTRPQQKRKWPVSAKIFALLLFFSFTTLLSGCGGSQSGQMKRSLVLDRTEEQPQEEKKVSKPKPNQDNIPEIQQIADSPQVQAPLQPGYQALAKLLDKKSRKKGIQFFKNQSESYMFFTLDGENKFSIADKTGTCLFEIEVIKSEDPASLGTPTDLDLTSGPCGLLHPEVSDDARKKVAGMAEQVFPALLERLNGGPWLWGCSDKNFLKQSLLLNHPYELAGDEDNLESYIAGIGLQIKNPLNIAFGDVVFFSPEKNKKAVGIYAGYGLLVYNKSCDSAGVHRLTGNFQYRFYRILTGFSWTNHQVHDAAILKKNVENP